MEIRELAESIIAYNRPAIQQASVQAASVAALIYRAHAIPADVKTLRAKFESQIERALREGCEDGFNYGEVYDEHELVYVRTHGCRLPPEPREGLGPHAMLFDVGVELSTQTLCFPPEHYDAIVSRIEG